MGFKKAPPKLEKPPLPAYLTGLISVQLDCNFWNSIPSSNSLKKKTLGLLNTKPQASKRLTGQSADDISQTLNSIDQTLNSDSVLPLESLLDNHPSGSNNSNHTLPQQTESTLSQLNKLSRLGLLHHPEVKESN
ncbi:hypothetical protein PSTG_13652 [Puccinia striiformis f. sp. tritici PST-78]|uniref:Uncharacterized protein n=1 Tax=Puccinia striiformis f. sp. tritici PST-78 TaxID=1165861 RepID=A0A0L0V0Y6_9BASI|nr:hypothetical protein PSTG_13652 [Puccinia striiformis f. sp. tritici PST-78]